MEESKVIILADENIDHSIIAAIRNVGFVVNSVYESERGIQDEAVIVRSRTPPQLILTEDKDFGTWVFSHNVRDISVILLRYEFLETEMIKSMLCQLLLKSSKELIGCFTTVTTKKIRTKRIE